MLEITDWVCMNCQIRTYNWRQCPRCKGDAVEIKFVPEDYIRAQARAEALLELSIIFANETQYGMSLAPDPHHQKYDIGYVDGWNECRLKVINEVGRALVAQAALGTESER